MRNFDKFQIFPKEETYYKHPLEDCVCRTFPNGTWNWKVYLRFSGEDEYEPARGSSIVMESLTLDEPEWITKQEYENF